MLQTSKQKLSQVKINSLPLLKQPREFLTDTSTFLAAVSHFFAPRSKLIISHRVTNRQSYSDRTDGRWKDGRSGCDVYTTAS